MQRDVSGRQPPEAMADAELWRRSRDGDAVDDDEAFRFVELAAFAEGRCDADEHELVSAWLARDPDLVADVFAARAVVTEQHVTPAAEAIVQRAVAALPATGTARILPFPKRRPAAPGFAGWAGWGSLVAAMAFASWLGFTLGVDTTRSLSQAGPGVEDGFLQDLFDPSAGFIRDFGDGVQT
jgi:hypothetical protein